MENNTNTIIISKLYKIFSQAIQQQIFPGAAMAVAWGAPEKRKRLIQTFGHTTYSQENLVEQATVYDLASLTKPLATTLAILSLLKEEQIKLSDLVSEIFPQMRDSSLHNISIKDILCHSAGFSAHKPYYLELVGLAAQKRKDALLGLLIKEAPVYESGSTSIYSDLGFMLLGLIVKKKSGAELNNFFKEKIAEPLGLADKIFYGPVGSGKTKKQLLAPTEDCPFRKRVLYGEVSDENAFALGGVAGHAGLFGTISGVLEMGVHLLDQWQGREEHPNYLASDLRRFLIRQDIPGSTWALGFDTPSSTGSSGGRYLAPTSVGHLGFTGTSFWIDPSRNLVMVLLSNRVHPSRDKAELSSSPDFMPFRVQTKLIPSGCNNRIKQFRPLFHETIMESLSLV